MDELALKLALVDVVKILKSNSIENQIIIHLMYGAYDTDKDFFTQFVKNSEELIGYLSRMLDVCRNCCIKKDEY